MSKLAYRKSTGLLPLSLSTGSSSNSNPIRSSFSSTSSSSLQSFEPLNQFNAISNDIYISRTSAASSNDSRRAIRRASSASLLPNCGSPIRYVPTDSPSWISERSRKSSWASDNNADPSKQNSNLFRPGRRRDGDSTISTSFLDPRFSSDGLIGKKLVNGQKESDGGESQEIEVLDLDSSWASNTITQDHPPIDSLCSSKHSISGDWKLQRKLDSDQTAPLPYKSSREPMKPSVSPKITTTSTSNRPYPPSSSRTRGSRRPHTTEGKILFNETAALSNSFGERVKDQALAEAVRRIVVNSAINSGENLDDTFATRTRFSQEKRSSVSSIALEFPDVPVRAPLQGRPPVKNRRRPRTQEEKGRIERNDLRRNASLSYPTARTDPAQSPDLNGSCSTAPCTAFSKFDKPLTPNLVNSNSNSHQAYSTPQSTGGKVFENGKSTTSTSPPSAWKKGVGNLNPNRPQSVDLATEIISRSSCEDFEVGQPNSKIQISVKRLDPPIQLLEKSTDLNRWTGSRTTSTSSSTSPFESIAKINARRMNQRFSYSMSNSLEDELNSKKSEEMDREGVRTLSSMDEEDQRFSSIKNFSRPISMGMEIENQLQLQSQSQSQSQRTLTKSKERESKSTSGKPSSFSDYDRANEIKDSPSSITSNVDYSFFDVVSTSHSIESPMTSPEIESRPLPKSSVTVSREHSNSNSVSSTNGTDSSCQVLLNLNGNGKFGFGSESKDSPREKFTEKAFKKSKRSGLSVMFKKVFRSSNPNPNFPSSSSSASVDGGNKKSSKSSGFKCSPTSSMMGEEEGEAINQSRQRDHPRASRLNARASNDVIFPILRGDNDFELNRAFIGQTFGGRTSSGFQIQRPFDPFASSRTESIITMNIPKDYL